MMMMMMMVVEVVMMMMMPCAISSTGTNTMTTGSSIAGSEVSFPRMDHMLVDWYWRARGIGRKTNRKPQKSQMTGMPEMGQSKRCQG